MKLVIYFDFIFILCLAISCKKPVTVMSQNALQGDSVRFKYAEHINIVKYPYYSIVELKNPWKEGDILHRYILVDRADSSKVTKIPKGTVVYIPVKSSVVYNAPHCQLLSWLNAGNVIKGVCDKKYMKLEFVQDGLQKGKIVDCGSSMIPMVERIIELNPDIIMLSPFENAGYGQIEKTGIPIIECAEYMETSALGRAEWMKFYGLLLGCREKADSLFDVVDSCYSQLKNKAKKSKIQRMILTERKTGDVWYCPGGRSSMGKMFNDANIKYAFSSDMHSGSLSLSPEFVIDNAGESDIWLIMSDSGRPITREDLLMEYSGYAELKSFRNKEIYVCYTSKKKYFEEISFRPDFLLKDLIYIFHPDVSLMHNLRYYIKL